MKKLLMIVLTLALCFTAFACGETYTEVSEENYAETLNEFVGEENELTVGITNNVRIWMKTSESDGTTTEGTSIEMIYTGEGEDLKVLMEMKELAGDTSSLMMGAYIADGYIYAETPNYVDPDGENIKAKAPYSEVAAEMAGIQDAIDAINNALSEAINIDTANAEFMASIGKLEISGNAGGDRKLRLTITKTDEETNSSSNGTITLAFDKDNKVTGLDMNATTTSTEDDATMTITVEMKIETCSSITFPSFEGFTEE